MRILAAVEEKIRRAIRDARAKEPLISIVALQETLERQFNRTFTREYLAKLSDKVARQTLVEIDRAKIEERMDPHFWYRNLAKPPELQQFEHYLC